MAHVPACDVMAHRIVAATQWHLVNTVCRSSCIHLPSSSIADVRFEGYFYSQIVQCPAAAHTRRGGIPLAAHAAGAAFFPSPRSPHCTAFLRPWASNRNAQERRGRMCAMPYCLHIHEMVASSPEIICTARFKTALGRPLQANTTARCESWLGRITRALSIPHRRCGTFRRP